MVAMYSPRMRRIPSSLLTHAQAILEGNRCFRYRRKFSTATLDHTFLAQCFYFPRKRMTQADMAAFAVHPEIWEIPPHEHRYVSAHFRPNEMRSYRCRFEAIVSDNNDPSTGRSTSSQVANSWRSHPHIFFFYLFLYCPCIPLTGRPSTPFFLSYPPLFH